MPNVNSRVEPGFVPSSQRCPAMRVPLRFPLRESCLLCKATMAGQPYHCPHSEPLAGRDTPRLFWNGTGWTGAII